MSICLAQELRGKDASGFGRAAARTRASRQAGGHDAPLTPSVPPDSEQACASSLSGGLAASESVPYRVLIRLSKRPLRIGRGNRQTCPPYKHKHLQNTKGSEAGGAGSVLESVARAGQESGMRNGSFWGQARAARRNGPSIPTKTNRAMSRTCKPGTSLHEGFDKIERL